MIAATSLRYESEMDFILVVIEKARERGNHNLGSSTAEVWNQEEYPRTSQCGHVCEGSRVTNQAWDKK
jgi:hypothetical protein